MRAAVYKGSGRPWVVEELPDPEPGPGELVIKVHRCGVCGTDLHLTSGHPMDFPAGSVLGHEYAGEVVAIGRGVSGFKEGDLITSVPAAGCGQCDTCRAGNPVLCTALRGYSQGYAEYASTPADYSMKLPQSLTAADGALIEPLAVGLHGAALAGIEPGSRVVVLGAGAVALSAIFWARQLGAGKIVAMSRSPRRAEKTMQLGADGFVAFGEDEAAQVAAILDGPPDIVFEAVGVGGMLGKAIERVRVNGTVVSMGCGLDPDPLVPMLVGFKQIKIIFSMAWTKGEFEHVARTLDRGRLEPRHMLTKTIGLGELPGMIEALRANNTETKVHVNPWA